MLLSFAFTGDAIAAHADPDGLAFFESRIRPVLIAYCYECHSAESEDPKGGLLLDSAAGLLAGGESGPALVVGQPDDSSLLEALRYEGLEMPPDGRLPNDVIRDFEKWVAMGAPDPRNQPPATTAMPPAIDIDRGRDFWAFRPLDVEPLPAIQNTDWPRSDIDVFIMSKLETAGLYPAPDAEPETLVRRLWFDLTGLPPSPDELALSLADWTPASVTAITDRLLNSPQFGVHWGRHWLDVARYADSNGSDFNATFHNAWRYRDYVFNAMNNDKPFDRFVREQIAGDLLPYESDARRTEQMVATGFLMLGTKMLSERDKEKLRMDVIDEQISTVGSAFLGLTLGCARCHDHKFDPIPTRDYYALAGIFRNTRTLEGESQKYVSTWPRTILPADPQHVNAVQQHNKQKQEIEKQVAAAKKTLKTAEAALKQLKAAKLKDDNANPDAESDTELEAATSAVTVSKAEVKQRENELKEWNQSAPLPLPRAISVSDYSEITDCEICIRGEHTNRGDPVPRGFLQVIASELDQRLPTSQSGRRELADWIVSADNSLPPRVIVNRVWAHLLGEGIVWSVDNFGELGERPTHPELLDRLALQFISPRSTDGDQSETATDGHGWSIKQLIRDIVCSRVYQISSRHDESAWQTDPENRLLWRANRKRLPAESIRDAMLSISGQLNPLPGGSPVEGLGTLVTTNSADAKEYTRERSQLRSAYLPIIRNELPPELTVFDFADPDLVVGKRPVTNVPAQALMLINSPLVMDSAERTARRLCGDDATLDESLITRIYRTVLARTPNDMEVARAMDFVNAIEVAKSTPSDGTTTAGSDDLTVRLSRLIHVLLASTEFRMLN